MIEIQDLKVVKQGQCICQIKDLEVAKGETLLIEGSNGSGKSTLLRAVAGLETRYEGSISIDCLQQEIGFVIQDPWMFRGTVFHNLEYGLQTGKVSGTNKENSVAKVLVHDIANQLGIDSLLSQNATQLSGGERRKVAIGRALIRCPKLLLLDEPFAELDETGIGQVVDALNGRELTMMVASPVAPPSIFNVVKMHRLAESG